MAGLAQGAHDANGPVGAVRAGAERRGFGHGLARGLSGERAGPALHRGHGLR